MAERTTDYELITVLGPTASGKTRFAAALADALNTEIISADSRQVFRQMDIGTGKDLADYIIGEKRIPCHLVDICPAGEKYSVYRFQKDFFNVFKTLKEKNPSQIPILCGGTGLYIEAVLRGYAFDNSEAVYPPVNSLIVGIDIDRDLRRERISRRLKTRLDEGMLDEVQSLLDSGVPSDALISYGLEYRYLTLYLLGRLKYDEMFRLLEIAIHQFAKRQMTWFRGMEERRGFKIHWVDCEMPTEAKIEFVRGKINTES